jgi:flagellin-like hook-associated protein FlgL
MLDGTEGVKLEEIAAQIRTLQTRMQASYQTTSLLSELSLVNYM